MIRADGERSEANWIGFRDEMTKIRGESRRCRGKADPRDNVLKTAAHRGGRGRRRRPSVFSEQAAFSRPVVRANRSGRRSRDETTGPEPEVRVPAVEAFAENGQP